MGQPTDLKHIHALNKLIETIARNENLTAKQQVEKDFRLKNEVLAKPDRLWFKYLIKKASQVGVYLPYVKVIEKDQTTRAYYAYTTGRLTSYFLTKDHLYAYQGADDPIPDGAMDLKDIATGYKPEELKELIDAIFYYSKWREDNEDPEMIRMQRNIIKTINGGR